MKLFKLKNKFSSGFTLIELLVVIGILGILSATMIATIDPFEQLKKGQDAAVQNATVEFVNGTIRYYTTHNTMPWADTINTAVGGCTSLITAMEAETVAVALNDDDANDCLGALINDGELKSTFTTAGDTLQKIFISTGGKDPNNNVVACFRPTSKSQANNPNCRYNSVGEIDTTVGHDPGDTSDLCFWCAL